MAHYAFLDENNIVTQVIVGNDETEDTNWEQFYAEVKSQPCKRTSYNGNIRKNFAGIGYYYDETRDAFIGPKCHDEAVLNEETCQWNCPSPTHVIILNEAPAL